MTRVLRHRPEELGLTLDAGGFVPLESLAAALTGQRTDEAISAEDLRDLWRADLRRFEVQDGRIRARYGHTVSIDIPGERTLPPEWLYIGASPAEEEEIRKGGLQPRGRRYVHLSTTPQAAAEVGQRHAPDAVVVVVFARRAHRAGVDLWKAGPWLFLAESIPSEHVGGR